MCVCVCVCACVCVCVYMCVRGCICVCERESCRGDIKLALRCFFPESCPPSVFTGPRPGGLQSGWQSVHGVPVWRPHHASTVTTYYLLLLCLRYIFVLIVTPHQPFYYRNSIKLCPYLQLCPACNSFTTWSRSQLRDNISLIVTLLRLSPAGSSSTTLA